MTRRMIDSHKIFEWCMWGMALIILFILAAPVVSDFVAGAIDAEMKFDEAKVKAHVGRMK